MSYLACITNDIPDLRSCTVKGKHDSFCRGLARRYNRVTERVEETADECTGCLPRRAEHGLLCWMCWEKVRDALGIAVDMVTHLRSVERAQQHDNAGVRSKQNWVIPIPITWRTADELLMLLGHPAPGFPSDANVWEVEAIAERTVDAVDAEAWVAREAGAEAAVRFYLLMQQAMASHPMAEYEHRIRNVRCPKCKRRSLLWKPPLMFEHDVRVVCTNSACDMELDQTSFETVALIEEKVAKSAAERARRAAEEAETA